MGFCYRRAFYSCGYLAAFFLTTSIDMPHGFGLIVGLQAMIALLLLFGPIVQNVMAYNNTFYLITDRRALIQTGAIGIDTRIIEFNRIQEIYVSVDFVDKIFGTGNIKILAAGGWPKQAYIPTLVALRNPYQVHEILQNAIEGRNINVYAT